MIEYTITELHTTIVLTVARPLRFRIWIAKLLVRLAAWVIRVGYEERTTKGER